MSTISVILANAQYLVRVGLKHILSAQPQITIFGEASNETALLERLQLQPADVVLIDYNQPNSFSKDSIKQIKDQCPDIGILVISADSNKERIYEVLEAGVTSFLTTSCDDTEIVEGIQAVAQNQRYFCRKVMDYVFERSFAPTAEDCAPLPLTQREIEVVQLAAKGLIAKEIASHLNLSTHTIYTHRKNIMRKLKINTSSELILYAVNQGLV